MAAPHSFWVIVDGTTPTAFRARQREDLLPTLKQLQRTQPAVVLRWFDRGQLWESPIAALEALKMKRRLRSDRGPAWRPGGSHVDPRERFQLTRDQKRARFKRRQFGKPGGPEAGKPGTGEAWEPGSSGARKPGSWGPRKPGSWGPRKPGSWGAGKPGSSGARKPGGWGAGKPGSSGARKPGSWQAGKPGSSGARKPGSWGAGKPGSSGARKPGSWQAGKPGVGRPFRTGPRRPRGPKRDR